MTERESVMLETCNQCNYGVMEWHIWMWSEHEGKLNMINVDLRRFWAFKVTIKISSHSDHTLDHVPATKLLMKCTHLDNPMQHLNRVKLPLVLLPLTTDQHIAITNLTSHRTCCTTMTSWCPLWPPNLQASLSWWSCLGLWRWTISCFEPKSTPFMAHIA